MPTNRLTGKAASLTFAGNDVKLTKATLKTTRELADATDSGDYDPTSGLIHKVQIPWGVGSEISVEGKIRTNSPTTLSALLAKCYSSTAEAVGTLKMDGSTNVITGNWDIADFEAEIDTQNACTFKATLKSNGLATPGS